MHCWPVTEVKVKSGVKEEPMKKFIYVTVALMLMLIFIGCVAPMTPEQRKELYESREINNLTEGVEALREDATIQRVIRQQISRLRTTEGD